MTENRPSVELGSLTGWRGSGDGLAALAERLLDDGLAPDRPAAGLWLPGRVELFGKHTDYAGGRSLVNAIDRGLLLLAALRADTTVHWRDYGRGVEAQFDVSDPGGRPGHWSNYLLTPARRVAADFRPLAHGADVAMVSDLPPAAGLSSSSALLTAAYLIFELANGELAPLGADRCRLAAYLGAVENGLPFEGRKAADGVGTLGGSQDHAAILCASAGEVLQLGYRPLAIERRLAWPSGWRLAIGVSGVHAKKTGGAREAFNRLARDAAAAAATFRRATGSPAADLGAALVAAGGGAELERVVAAAAPSEEGAAWAARVRQFALETDELIPAAADALVLADAAGLGRAAAASQRGAEELLGNQVAETVALTRLALDNGAWGASAFGGGFGGSVWALAPAAAVEAFLARWRTAYTAAFPQHRLTCQFFAGAPAAGAHWRSPPAGRTHRDADG